VKNECNEIDCIKLYHTAAIEEAREADKATLRLALKEAKEMDEASQRSAAEEAREKNDAVVVLRRVLLGEGVGYRLGVAPLAAVEGRVEGDLGAEVAPVDVIAVTPLRPVYGAVFPGERGERGERGHREHGASIASTIRGPGTLQALAARAPLRISLRLTS
jgi:hypothetical protein